MENRNREISDVKKLFCFGVLKDENGGGGGGRGRVCFILEKKKSRGIVIKIEVRVSAKWTGVSRRQSLHNGQPMDVSFWLGMLSGTFEFKRHESVHS